MTEQYFYNKKRSGIAHIFMSPMGVSFIPPNTTKHIKNTLNKLNKTIQVNFN